MSQDPAQPLRPIRKIIHLDMDAFYASVEQLDHPELRGKPVAVGGSPDRRGVVAAASYEARRYGVRSAMSSRRAKTLCPPLVFVRPNFPRYRALSATIQEVFLEVTKIVEPLSLDEAFLDVTENELGEPLAGKIARHLKHRIKEVTGLTASAGVGPNKFIAKLASDLSKPDGLMIVPPSEVEAFLAPLGVERLWGVGPATARRLHERGMFTISDLRSRTRGELETHFGRLGSFLFDLAFGRDERRVQSVRLRKSRGTERTFDTDCLDLGRLKEVLAQQASRIWRELEADASQGRTVTLKLRYGDFTTVTRSKSRPKPVRSAREIADLAGALLESSTEAGRRPVRLIGVSVSNFERNEESPQLWLPLGSR